MLWRDDRRAVAKTLAEVPGAELENDVEVRIRGRVELYAPQGRLQLVMTGIDPVFTVGEIAVTRARVLQALAAEGVLERNRRLALPLVPLRVGLVTSAGSAAYHDFVQELKASGLAFRGRRRRRAGAGRGRVAPHRLRPAPDGRPRSRRGRGRARVGVRVPTSVPSTPTRWRG